MTGITNKTGRAPHHLEETVLSLCNTVERHDVVVIFLELYEPLIEVLHADGDFGLASQINEPQFIGAVMILSKVLGVTKGLSESL